MIGTNEIHDYYDGCISQHGYGKEGNIFFRKPITYKQDLPENLKFLSEDVEIKSTRLLDSKRKSYYFKFFKVLVCGKLYGGVRVIYDTKSLTTIFECGPNIKTEFFYDYDKLESFMKEKELKFDEFRQTKYYWGYGGSKNVCESSIKDHLKVVDKLQQCIDTKSVIATIMPTDRYFEFEIELNSELKKFEFYKCMDAFTIWQELAMFIDGTLASPGNYTIEIADKYKIEGHGFDTKYGFRTRPNP